MQQIAALADLIKFDKMDLYTCFIYVLILNI